MYVVQPDCRDRLTARDVDYIAFALCSTEAEANGLRELLADTVARDEILDSKKLLRAVLEDTACIQISRSLYFYLIVRHAFLTAGIEDRELADYVAAMLVHFSICINVWPPGHAGTMDYTIDIIQTLQNTSGHERFALHAHAGNFSLFLAGIFADRIRSQTERRAAPDVGYYESFGKTNFSVAGEHGLARRYQLSSIFHTLAQDFHGVRLAINDMIDRLTFCGKPYFPSKYDLGI